MSPTRSAALNILENTRGLDRSREHAAEDAVLYSPDIAESREEKAVPLRHIS